MRLARPLMVSLVFAACGGETNQPSQTDAPVQQTGCTDESDCSGTTPYCETTTGACVTCRFSSHCAADNEVCDNYACRPAHSCKELHEQLPALTSGVYRIDIDGAGTSLPVDVYCEMTTDGGGWTLIQRTRWTWAASQALSTNFDTWHDTTIGSAGVGFAYRLAGVNWPALAANGELLASYRLRTTSGSACNPLNYKTTGAQIVLDKTAKSALIMNFTQPVSMLTPNPSAGMATLSTTDTGPDSAQCVNTGHAVPWFYNSCCSTCATYQGSYWTDEPHPMASTFVATTADLAGNTETAACGAQSPQLAADGAFRGVDTMEMYLR